MARWKNFELSEFSCSHCGKNEINESLIDVLQRIRAQVGFGMPISSGYRCGKHPVETRKAKPGSHASGLAADVSVSHKQAFDVLKAALRDPEVTGIGISQKGKNRFIHIDIAPEIEGRPRPHLWSY